MALSPIWKSRSVGSATPLCRNVATGARQAPHQDHHARRSAPGRWVVVQQSRRTAMKPLRLLAVRFLVAVACGIASAVLGSMSATADDGPDLAAIDRYVRSEMDAQRIPGLALGIVHGDRIVHVQGFGQADRSGRRVTPQTPFLIGSVTKSFTALAIMQLSEAGRLQLDAPVQRYLPWWRVADPDASTQVTVRHLLYQVSGLSKATGNAYATSGDTHELRPRGPGPGAAQRRTHPAGGHDLAVQQRQLLDPGHDRASGLRAVLRDLRSAAHLRPAGDAQLLSPRTTEAEQHGLPTGTATGTASRSPPSCRSIEAAWAPAASAPARRT